MEKALPTANKRNKSSFSNNEYIKDFKYNWELYLLIIPVLLFYVLFCYKPMYGIIIAFKDFQPALGIWDSPWVGLEHFKQFFTSFYFSRILYNTVYISFLTIIFGFPAPIILALLINELRNKLFTRTVQTITYLPHFISIVVIVGMIQDLTKQDGVIGGLVSAITGQQLSMMSNPAYFVPIYVVSDIWQHIGWSSIIYLAAIAAIDQEQYEAAFLDGANRFQQMRYITLPGIIPTITVLFILRLGGILNVGFEKVFLMYSPATYETADVISTYVYRKGLQEFNFGYSTAVGLFNSIINYVFVVGANYISKKVNKISLW